MKRNSGYVYPQNGEFFDEYGDIHNIIEHMVGAVVTMNAEHRAIHDGNGFNFVLYLASLAAAGVKTWRFKCLDEKFIHLKNISVTSKGATIRIDLIKDATITNAGTLILDTSNNLNANSANESCVALYDSGVTFTGGKIWDSMILQGDTTNQTVSVGSFQQNINMEYVTVPDDDYIIRVTNLSTEDAASNIMLNAFYYAVNYGTD